ncbi:hypothetical protein BCT16_00305 [Vibrio sp. 10N.222.54.B6]|nr:hypothetical protein BCU05_11170 [Vibrio sp. 10N.261.54.C3]PMK73650.1 hypothetical protein BCT92_07560 [Vibrio sp. 10N.261.52.E5]PML74745.1 hypothetical protein BCT71_04955 [Vibrio sp. 10N.261.51.A7]PMO03081.1 hypothetical protein BCT20_09420 [Vibrio sp. 10N.222.55.C12]PMO13683.1 hypothetical protein BCT17_13400 [Vibrio sp. 10N.222.54.F10]PMO27083.1 hypothetical protein BCT16_00305 [Vibrio sp. 10N.222.54.B6]
MTRANSLKDKAVKFEKQFECDVAEKRVRLGPSQESQPAKEITPILAKNVSNQLILLYRFITILRLKGMASSLFCVDAVSLFLFLNYVWCAA